jgi:nucleoside-diphosphate-sugar epimerase
MGLHVVCGAGQIGTLVARELVTAGQQVRVVRRGKAASAPGVEVRSGDLADAAFCRQALQGAAVVYHCMNPEYNAALWERLIPQVTRNLVDAAEASRARLVVMDNLYMLGRGDGRPINEDTPVAPCSRKGEVRARAAEALLQAHRAGRVEVVIGRASDFYGPEGGKTHFGDHFWPAALRGKTVRMLIDPGAVHTYHYTVDVARGLVALAGAQPADCGRVWMLPCQPAGTARALVARLAEALGRPIALAGTPRAMAAALALVMPALRELKEMLYQWDLPFVVDDTRFRARFGLQPVPVAQAAQDTVAWVRQRYGGPG